MNKMFRKTLFKLAFWLLADLVLSFSGLDKLASYCEYLEKSFIQLNSQSYLWV